MAMLICAVVAASGPPQAQAADNPTAYEVMIVLMTAAKEECDNNGPSCRAFQDMQRQLGAYIETQCKRLALSSNECAATPIKWLLRSGGQDELEYSVAPED